MIGVIAFIAAFIIGRDMEGLHRQLGLGLLVGLTCGIIAALLPSLIAFTLIPNFLAGLVPLSIVVGVTIGVEFIILSVEGAEALVAWAKKYWG